MNGGLADKAEATVNANLPVRPPHRQTLRSAAREGFVESPRNFLVSSSMPLRYN
jgi:hypothetical protein